MPVFTIETPGGKHLDIEAADQATAMQGAQQWHAQQQPSGYADNFLQGASEMAGGTGRTLETYTGKGPVGTWLQQQGAAMAPKDFVPSPLYDENGLHPSNIGLALAHGTPAAVGTLAAATMAPEALGTAGAIGLGTLAGTLMSAGDAAKSRAVARTGDANAVPDTSDKAVAGLTTLVSQGAQSMPIGRFLGPGKAAIAGNVIANTGLKGVGNAATKALGSTVDQAAASGASNVISQAGNTVGTPGGLTVDPTQAINAAATGGAVGGVFAGKRMLPEALDAAKYSKITDDLKPAAVQFANMMQQAADGRNTQGSLFSSGDAQRTGKEIFIKARDAVHSDLKDAVDSVTTPLSTDAQNIISSAQKGDHPTPGDYATLKSALAGDPQGANVINSLQRNQVADIVRDTGYFSDNKFYGGGAGALGHALTGEHVTKTALAAAVGGEMGHLITFSPEMLGVAAGATVGKGMLDNMTGAQAPAGRFIRNFADGVTPVRLGVPQAPVAPPPAAPVSPFGGSPMAGGPSALPMIPPAMRAQMNAQAYLSKQAPTPVPAAGPNPQQLKLQLQSALNQMKVTGAIKRAVNGAPVAPAQAPAAPSAAAPPVAPQTISKANGQTKVNDDPFPPSSYAHMPDHYAAAAITNAGVDANTVKFPSGHRAGTLARLSGERAVIARIRKEAPGLPGDDVDNLTGRLQGRTDRADATAFREQYLKAKYPQAAPVIDKYLSDEVIKNLWPRKSPPKK